MPLSFVHPVHRATHRIGLYLDKLCEPGLTQGEAHILATLAHSGPAKVAELHRHTCATHFVDLFDTNQKLRADIGAQLLNYILTSLSDYDFQNS